MAVAGTPTRTELAAMLALLVAARASRWRALLRLGWIADYFSRPVLIGYLHGVAIMLVIGQLAKLLGIDVDAREPSRACGRPCASSATSAAPRSRVGAVSLTALLSCAASCRACPAR